MALRIFKCEACGAELRTLKAAPEHCSQKMTAQLSVPQVNFLEPRDPEHRRGKSVLKDANKILRERAKAHTRDNELHELVQNNHPLAAKMNGWVNKDGVTRKRIDEI